MQWLQESKKQQERQILEDQKKPKWGSQTTSPAAAVPSGTLLRYYAIADDTNHPEVREVMRLAMAGLPGWELDPIDQVTEQVRTSWWG